MLGTLLDKLEALFSKRFALGSIPLLAVLFLHGLLAYRVSYHVQKWVALYFSLDATHVAVLSFALLLLVVILSYVFSTLSVLLREVLEGKYFGDLLSDALSQYYRDGLADVERRLDDAKHNRRVIREDAWRNTMGGAYQTGCTLQDCNYVQRPELALLFDLRAGNQNISPREIQAEVNAMTATLQTNSPILATQAASNLDKDHGALLQLIKFAADKWDAQVVKYLNEIQFDYAGKDVAPTKMGNISRIASYYAKSRYSMNLEIFWTRLQKVLQSDSNFYPVVQEAKMQLDFLIGLWWLTFSFTLIWVILLPIFGESEYLFLFIALFGPVLTWVWYCLALQNYRAFSDLLRAAIDLYRLDLFKSLHVALPANAEQERVLWKTLERRLAYGEHPNLAVQNP